jgi:uncharacterized protein (TIRG00374 family)
MRKRILIGAAILLLLFLLWREEEAWSSFAWATLWQQARGVKFGLVLCGTALIYAAFLLRSFRWKLLLRPLRRTTTLRVLGPTLVGFTALALLGRPGELARPYLLARREKLSVSSQLGVWTLERFFDVAAFAVLFAASFLLSPDIRRLPHFGQVHRAMAILMVVAAAAAAVLMVLYRTRTNVAAAAEKAGSPLMLRLSRSASAAMRSFAEVWKKIEGPGEVAAVGAVSLAMWLVIAGAYWSVIHAFAALNYMTFAEVVLLMAFGLTGSLVQSPGAGAAQLVTVAVLLKVFGASGEVAIACGLLLWLATTMAPVPAGIVLLNLYGLSLRRVSRQSAEQSGASPD